MAEFEKPGSDADPVERLSDRQRQCLELVAQGRTSKQIARELGLSPSTIDNHLGAAVERMGMKSRVEAARALRNATSTPHVATIAVREEPEPFSGPEPLPAEHDALWTWGLPPSAARKTG